MANNDTGYPVPFQNAAPLRTEHTLRNTLVIPRSSGKTYQPENTRWTEKKRVKIIRIALIKIIMKQKAPAHKYEPHKLSLDSHIYVALRCGPKGYTIVYML